MIMINNNLRTFVTVAELGSLTEAAKRLYVSQPAVSQAIKKLEEELGVTLFVRDRRSGLALTHVGERMLELAFRLQDIENKMYQVAYEENHLLGGALRIATVPLGLSLVLSRVLPKFRERFPGVTVELAEGTPFEVKRMVMESRADLGITTSPYLGLESRLLLRDQIVSISCDGAHDVDLAQVSGDVILCRVARDSIVEQLGNRGLDLSRGLVVEAASTQVNLVEAGMGTGVISKLMLSTIPNELVVGKVVPTLEMEIGLVAQEFSELSPAARTLADMIAAYID